MSTAPESTLTHVDLLEMESSAFMYIDGVTTVTLFDGKVPLEQLKDRLFKVVQASPWLAGKFVRKKGDKKTVQMAYDPLPTKEFVVEKLFDQIELDISASEPCDVLIEKLKKTNYGDYL